MRRIMNRANGDTPSRSNGVASTVASRNLLARPWHSGNSVSSFGSKIMNVNRLAVDDGAASTESTS